MKRSALLLIALFPWMMSAQPRDRDWRAKDDETIRRTFTVPASPQKLVVDNVSGYIHVTGYAGNDIQVTAQKHIDAETDQDLARAKTEVKLDMSQEGNSVRLFVNGPFRTADGVSYRGDNYYRYRVTFDFDIQVPAATEVTLKTINHGTIEVRKTTGDFDIHGLNGGIEMEAVSGSGNVHTLNGPVKVSFSRNPSRNSTFETLNGKVDVHFQPGLNAELKFHRLNGHIYSDFDIAPQPVATTGEESRNGRFVYRSGGRDLQARVGSGGPQLSFRTLNGAISLYSKAL